MTVNELDDPLRYRRGILRAVFALLQDDAQAVALVERVYLDYAAEAHAAGDGTSVQTRLYRAAVRLVRAHPLSRVPAGRRGAGAGKWLVEAIVALPQPEREAIVLHDVDLEGGLDLPRILDRSAADVDALISKGQASILRKSPEQP